MNLETNNYLQSWVKGFVYVKPYMAPLTPNNNLCNEVSES